MKVIAFLTLLISFMFQSSSSQISTNENSPDSSNRLWYKKPASIWPEALPIGNGRLGAMIYGKTASEVIQFNEETLWAGQPHDYSHKGAYKVLNELRNLLWEGKQSEAEKLANERFMSQPFGQQCYEPFGDVLLDFPGHDEVAGYRRELNLRNAVSTVSYEVNGVKFRREMFSSAPGQVIAIHIEADKDGEINFIAGLDCPHKIHSISVEGDEVILKGRANDYPREKGMDGYPYPKSKLIFEARLKVSANGGKLIKKAYSIQVKGANSTTLYLAAATSFVNYKDISADPEERCKSYLLAIEGKRYEDLKAQHIADYKKYYDRVTIDLGESEISHRPTDERLTSFKQDEDPSLVALLYQYGRYLLISSSRPGTQPANLQGIWNGRMAPPWDSKYTININTEMNYWPAEITNLSEMSEPLINMVKDLILTGHKVAKVHYNLPGWVTHHNTDIWRGAAPINHSNHGIWPSGGAWLSEHVWWHYQFTGDKGFLKNTAYPILKSASEFFSGYLTPDPNNPAWLVSGPSNSPENGGLVMGPTMDHQIIRNLFANTIEAANILGVDEEFASMLKSKRDSIAPNMTGRYGQLQEWLEDNDNPDSHHRHVSHLWGLHPGNEIHPLTTPELADACKVVLEHRGDGGTGWSRAWKINFWARLLDGDHAYILLKNLMTPTRTQSVSVNDKMGGLYPNLFDAHPPFQIDGNFGATSGITEMLLQSHLRDEQGNYFQDILPALPSKFSSGSISGIKGRGGFEFSIAWNDGKLTSVKVKSLLGNVLYLRYSGKVIMKNTKPRESYTFKSNDF